jgi:[acyl-carrier-protein] S-malonyltransferase
VTIPELLVRQVQQGVRMTDCIRAMGGLGLDAILEIGPGKVLSGFVKKTLPGMPVYALETVRDLEKLPDFLETIGEEQTL